MKLYDGEKQVGDWDQRHVKGLHEEYQDEGMNGVSPHFVINRISSALVKGGRNYVTPIDVLRSLRDGITEVTSSDEERKRLLGFIDEVRKEFDDLWNVLDTSVGPDKPKPRKFPPEPDKDLMGFLCDHSRDLEKWQRDILNMIREEMIYFIPQMRTKIINEGWASFWHERIMNDLPLTPQEHLEFRRLHSSVLSPGSKMSINPYYVGYNILRDIERRWNGEEDQDFPETNWHDEKLTRPTGEGLKKLFEARTDECDTTFLRKYLTQGLVENLDMYTYRLQELHGEQMWVVQETDWRHVRDTLIDGMTNFGIPVIRVEDADYLHRGELLLTHAYDGKPLDQDYTSRTLKNIQFLCKRPVHLQTIRDDKPILLSHDGDNFTESAPK